MLYLIVVRPFGSYRVGDIIKDGEAIAVISGSEHSAHVVRVQPPVEE